MSEQQPPRDPLRMFTLAGRVLVLATLLVVGGMRVRLLILGSLALLDGCASPTMHSVDPKANYLYVFGDVSAPEPTVIHSQVDREHRSVLGIFPLHSQYN